jgi:hypothetical protein
MRAHIPNGSYLESPPIVQDETSTGSESDSHYSMDSSSPGRFHHYVQSLTVSILLAVKTGTTRRTYKLTNRFEFFTPNTFNVAKPSLHDQRNSNRLRQLSMFSSLNKY